MGVFPDRGSSDPFRGGRPSGEVEEFPREEEEADSGSQEAESIKDDTMDERYREKYVDEKLERVRDEVRLNVAAFSDRMQRLESTVDSLRVEMQDFRREVREEVKELREDNKSTRKTVITTCVGASLAALALIVAIVIGGSQIAATITSAWLTTEHSRIEQKLDRLDRPTFVQPAPDRSGSPEGPEAPNRLNPGN